ncbi:MAG: MFS transporter [Candidatus Latescibacteria bacterium]|nr:MFS transporter [bacterium]MBD3425507.1 MFS transporter [Candidatus Latescibacterota bacterium]
MMERTRFPRVFWVANLVEVLERFSYYGIYMGFGIYMEYLGYSKGQLGIIQSIFLLISYTIPVISGTFADRYGFKKVLIISYLAYLPSILLLILTKSYSGVALTMLSIALAAGIFKPLVSGTVRAVTDKTNKTLGFGVFYAMVNVGASFGPLIAGRLRAISWNYAFLAAAISIGLMLLITIFFYKEPEREISGITLGEKFKDIWIALSDGKYLLFLILLGVFFWLPFWAFFNLAAIYIDKNLDTARLFMNVRSVFGSGFANFLSHQAEDGTRKLLGETIAHTGYVIMILQIFVSRIAERFKAIPTFLFGLFVMFVGFCVIGISHFTAPAMVLLGIALFALGEMLSSPRIQEYITWIAPKEKAGLYMGTNFLSTGLGGALSGVIYTSLYGYFRETGHPDYVWYALGLHMILGLVAIHIFTRTLGEFEELEE